MNEIRTGGFGGVAPGFGADVALDVAGLVGGKADGALGGVDTAGLVAQLMQLAKTIDVEQGQGQGLPGVTNSSGAPMLDGVSLTFSPEDMAAALQALQSKTADGQMRTAKEGLDTNRKKMEDTNARSMAKLNEWVQKSKEAEEKSKVGKIFGWITKIASFIAAVVGVAVAAVATVASGGAAAPMLAFAAIGLAAATVSLASAVSQELGGPALEPSALIAKAMTKLLTSLGMDQKQAESLGKVLAGAAVLAAGAGVLVMMDPALIGNMLGGAAELMGADEKTSMYLSLAVTVAVSLAMTIAMTVATGGMGAGAAVGEVAKTVQVVGTVAKAASGVAAGAGMVGKGVMDIQAAGSQKTADLAAADRKQMDAVLMRLQKQMEDDREELKKVMDQLMEGYSVVTKMINEAGNSRAQLAANISSRVSA
ncbi:type III secretion system translocon subunit SctE [Noviherbaspirillum sp. CPCC 100848]|uniref:Type III secretion system translocon subunit SctE n=1 Tax=Noviherbaspirillum album TaxID=3080276 RepID=A0ABU6JB24_9BURK|nr:type III secretion system translocon subunit SctE [Noviherbaspirillum sp. CPCC 100848]MEC4720733.1 type III secretion system translocon subunit SctE [Noviherbaspirillum sp. CPCC 100848]